MNSTRIVIASFGLLASIAAAQADATVSAVEGGVLVFKGHGFVRTTVPTALKVGDRAMVAQGNRGTVTFSDGCSVDLRPGAVQIIGPVSPCARAQGAPDQRNDQGAPGPLGDQSDLIGFGIAGAALGLGAYAGVTAFTEPSAFPPNPQGTPQSP